MTAAELAKKAHSNTAELSGMVFNGPAYTGKEVSKAYEDAYKQAVQDILDMLTKDPNWQAGITAASQLEHDFNELLPQS